MLFPGKWLPTGDIHIEWPKSVSDGFLIFLSFVVTRLYKDVWNHLYVHVIYVQMYDGKVETGCVENERHRQEGWEREMHMFNAW